MDARESSHSRRDDIHAVTAVNHPQSSQADAPPAELVVDADSTVQPQDVASLVSSPVSDEPIGSATQDVAGLVPAEPAREPESTLDEVKNLISVESPEAELTGAVQLEPDAVLPSGPARRRVFPRMHRPHVRAPKVRGRLHTFDSFRYRDYIFIWLATMFSSGGFWLQQVIVGWLTYEVTDSAFWTSVALGLDALPILFVGPVGGLLVDNFDRRKLMSFIYGYQAAVTLIFSAVVLTGNLQAWHIFAFIFFMGLAWVVTDPARMSLISNIVPRESLVNAFALNSMAFSVTRLATPAIGGVLIAFAGAGPALLVEAALQIGAVFAALSLRVITIPKPRMNLASVRNGLLEGIRYVLNTPLLLGLFALNAMPAMLIMPSVNGLMPVYAAEVFEVDARGLGLLVSAFGAGSTLGTFALASLGDIKAKGIALICGIIITAVTTLIFSVNAFFPTAYLNLMIISAAMMMYFSVTSAVVQGTVPDEYRGRVTGLYMITWGLFPLGSLLAGWLAENLGVQAATQITSGVMLLLLAFAAWRFRALWRMR